jgi:hypothetical protein
MTRFATGSGVLFLAVLGAACSSAGSPPPTVDGGSKVDSGGPVVAAPDLRFKWVGAGLQMHLYGLGPLPLGDVGNGFKITAPYGVTPLDLSGDPFEFITRGFSVPDLEPMIVTGASGQLPDIQSDLDQLVDARTVVVSLDTGFLATSLAAENGSYIAVLSGSQDGDLYEPLYQPYSRGTTTAAGLADWIATQLSPGQVVTALGPTSDGLFVTAFGRVGDSTSYETQVVTATLDDLVSQLQGLAEDGYVITAFGRADAGTFAAGNFVAVGTRAPGQTSPRTLAAVDQLCVAGSGEDLPVQSLFDEGYALIGAVDQDATGDCTGEPEFLYIGEQ